MEVVNGRTFSAGDLVRTDDTQFVNCRFENVQMRYGGGAHPEFVDCAFDGTGWYFDDAALRTIQLLQALGNGEGGRPFVENLFAPGNYIGE